MVELEDFKYGGTNITAFRLVDPNDELVQVVMTATTLKMLYSENNEFELKTLKTLVWCFTHFPQWWVSTGTSDDKINYDYENNEWDLKTLVLCDIEDDANDAGGEKNCQ